MVQTIRNERDRHMSRWESRELQTNEKGWNEKLKKI